MLGGFLVAVVAGDEDDSIAASDAAEAGELDLTAVPAEFREFILSAGTVCPEVSAALIAAQIEAESSWKPTAVSPSGAQGLTQFMPGTWAAYGEDADGDGTADPFSPADAISSQAGYMCALVGEVRDLADGDQQKLTDLILASYNAGPGAVRTYKGIPPFSETQNYVKKIRGMIRDTFGIAAGDGTGGWREPVAKPVHGTPFGKRGSAWAWKGWHTGADYPAPMGTQINAAADGKVKAILSSGAYGTHVIINHGTVDGHRVETLSAHMVTVADGLKVGQSVKAGTKLGFVGMTGNTFGPHLHFEVRLDWKGGNTDSEFTDPWAWIKGHRTYKPSSGSQGAAAAVKYARKQLGIPYSWAGGSLTGPSTGSGPGASTVGFDCSGLARAAVHAADPSVKLPRTSQLQVNAGTKVSGKPKAGDLVFFQLNGTSWDHVGIAVGDGTMIHAPRTGKNVEVTSITKGYYADKTQTIRRVL